MQALRRLVAEALTGRAQAQLTSLTAFTSNLGASAAAFLAQPARATASLGRPSSYESLSAAAQRAFGTSSSNCTAGSLRWPAHHSSLCRAPANNSSAARPLLLQQQQRWRTTSRHLVPKFTGGKIKPYSSYKRRFKLTGAGKVMYPRPGHVHKRFNKQGKQLFELSKLRQMKPKYAKLVKRLGFKMRSF